MNLKSSESQEGLDGLHLTKVSSPKGPGTQIIGFRAQIPLVLPVFRHSSPTIWVLGPSAMNPKPY